MGEAMVPMRTSTATAEMSLPGTRVGGGTDRQGARGEATCSEPNTDERPYDEIDADDGYQGADGEHDHEAACPGKRSNGPENWDCVLKIRRTSVGTKNCPAATPVSMKPAPEGRGDVSRSLRIGTIMPNMGTRQIMRLAVKKPTDGVEDWTAAIPRDPERSSACSVDRLVFVPGDGREETRRGEWSAGRSRGFPLGVGGVNEYSAERRTEHRPDAGGDVPASHRHCERGLEIGKRGSRRETRSS